MTPKQILDSFSETLMRDERILSARERGLLATLLHHAKSSTAESNETQQAVRAVIASAVGETVAQRAFAVLGGSIVERILEASSLTTDVIERPAEVLGPKDNPPSSGPQPPGVKAPHKEPLKGPGVTPPGPQPPGVKSPPGPQPPGTPLRTPGVTPPGPQPPGARDRTTAVASTTAAVAERPHNLPAKCVVLDEFLAPPEVEQLMRFAIEHEDDFRASEVIAPDNEGGVVNYEHRRSRVLMELQPHQDVILQRIRTVLPQVLDQLGMGEFAIADVEAQITASNDGDYFHFHSDNNSEQVASRQLTFVYFFHREPRQFEGGELRIYDARLEEGSYVSEGSYQTIAPQQNQIVFFPCELLHEITPVKCASQVFADSRFTLNGWLRQ